MAIKQPTKAAPKVATKARATKRAPTPKGKPAPASKVSELDRARIFKEYRRKLADLREIFDELAQDFDDADEADDGAELSKEFYFLAGRAEHLQDEAGALSIELRKALGLKPLATCSPDGTVTGEPVDDDDDDDDDDDGDD